MTERLAVFAGYAAMVPFTLCCVLLAAVAETVRYTVKLWKL